MSQDDEPPVLKLKVRRALRQYLKSLEFAFPMGNPIIAQLLKELRPSTSFDKDIQAAFDSLKQTNDLIERLRIDLAERYRKLADVKEKYETYSKLASTEKSQADAILEVVEKQAHHERYVNIAASAVTGIVIFLIGILIGHFFHW